MKHAVVIVPGLGDRVSEFEFATRNWLEKYDIEPIVHRMPWAGNEENFKQKLERLENKIDELWKKKYTISLLGTSAGASCVINAYCSRRNKIHTIITICGRLKKGRKVFPSLELAARNYISFKESVILCEKNIQVLTAADKKKILTLRPLFDELVPNELSQIKGATNIQIFSIEHNLSIILALTLYLRKITDFILN